MAGLHHGENLAPLTPARAGNSGGLLGQALAQVLLWQGRRRDRRQLAQMDAHLLRDIGLSERTASVEAEKPFWQA